MCRAISRPVIPKQPVSRDANNNFNELIFSQWMCGHCEKLLGMVEDDEVVSKMLYCSKNVHCVTLICNMKTFHWKGLSLWSIDNVYPENRCISMDHKTEHRGLTHCSRWLAMAALAWCTKPSFAKLARWLPSRKYFRSAWNFLSQNLYCWRTRWILEYLQDKRFKNRELQIMRRLDHCNIVSLLYFFYTSGEKKVSHFTYDVMRIFLYHCM